MKKVKLDFEFAINQFIQQVKDLSFESVDINLDDYTTDDPYVFKGTLDGIWIVDKLEILVNCRGVAGFKWSLAVEIGGKKLTPKPIEGKINKKGLSIHYKSYTLPA